MSAVGSAYPPDRPPVDRHVVVLGGGLAGLSAAYHLGGQVPVYEAADVLGGLCASHRVDGYTFDLTGHLLHFRVPYCRELVAGLLQEELLHHHRKAWIHYGTDAATASRVKYPFQANLHDLPADVRAECLDGFLAAVEQWKADNSSAGGRTRSRNFREWILARFGAGIARHFMLPYNAKLWQYPLDKMSSAWIDSLVPQPNVDEVVKGAAGPPPREFGYNIDFAYPRTGGIGRLAEAFGRELGPLHLGMRAVRIDPERRVVHFGDGSETRYETLVTSIPLPVLLRLLDPCPAEIRALADQLRWNSIVNLNLGVDGQVDPSVHWMYFPDPAITFYRVGVASNFAPESAPPGKSSMYVEVSYRGEDPHTPDVLTERIIDDLLRVGLLERRGQVEVTDFNRLPYAYVIYDLAYTETTGRLHQYLEAADIHSIGRFGRWRYYSMEQTILDGKTCAEDIRAAVAASR